MGQIGSGPQARKGIRIYQPTSSSVIEAEEARILYNESEHQSMALPENDSGTLVRSQSAIHRNAIHQTRNAPGIPKGDSRFRHRKQKSGEITNEIISMSSFMPSQHIQSVDTGTQNGIGATFANMNLPNSPASPHRQEVVEK